MTCAEKKGERCCEKGLGVQGFVVRDDIPFYQAHLLHALIHFLVGCVQQAGCGFDAGADEGHDDLCARYFDYLLHLCICAARFRTKRRQSYEI